ncbi:bacterial Na+/H+ antiporter B family protein, partial [Vibrio parahaemolyticus V-223/04]
LLPVHWLRS